MVAALLLLVPMIAGGQRVQFPTAIDGSGSPPPSVMQTQPSTAPGGVYWAPYPVQNTGPVTVPGTAPALAPSMVPSFAPGAAPALAPGGGPTFAPGTAPSLTPGVTPGWSPPVSPGYPPRGLVPSAPGGIPAVAPGMAPALAPGPAPGLTLPPPATFQGTIQAPGWDPYAPPGVQTQPLFPTDPFAQPGPLFGTTTPMTRLRKDIRFESYWLARTGSRPFGTDDAEASITFAFPLFYNQQTPLLVTPGFAIHLWDGPVSTSLNPAVSPDLPPRAYDAYLDVAWLPQPTPWLGADLDFRIGVYSDFSQVSTRSIRFPSHGLAVFTFSESFQVKAGVFFLDRNHIKLLPAGGVVWTPNKDTRFDILFPNPKLAKHLTTIGTAEWWLYARGEYGGGAWTVKRIDGSHNSVDYNDIRVAVGAEFEKIGGLRGGFEVGIAFDREIFYVETPAANIHPSPTVFLGGSMAF